MLSKRQRSIKFLILVPAIVAGLLFNYYGVMNLSRNLVGHGAVQGIGLLVAQITCFYYLTNLVVFRGKYWTRGERIFAFVNYCATLGIGLIVRGRWVSFDPSRIDTLFSLQRIELNPFSFISDFRADRSSLMIAAINAVLFIPMPILMAWNGIRPSIRKLIACALGLEVMQYIFQQGVFSAGDMLLYTAGFAAGLILLHGYQSGYEKKNLRHDSLVSEH